MTLSDEMKQKLVDYIAANQQVVTVGPTISAMEKQALGVTKQRGEIIKALRELEQEGRVTKGKHGWVVR